MDKLLATTVGDEDVAQAPNRLQEARLAGIGFDQLAKARDLNVQRTVKGFVFATASDLHQLIARKRLTRMTSKGLQDGKFARGERHRFAVLAKFTRAQVEFEFTELDDFALHGRSARDFVGRTATKHDLRTPLTRMRLEIELADLPDYSREAMVSDLEQMEGILNQFMVYARRSNQPLERVDLGLATNDTLVDMRIRQKADVVVETNITGNLFVMAQPMELKRAIQNLIVNADRYGRTPDTNTLELTIQVLAQGNDAVLRVADRGYGLPEEDMERVTRPFERGDRSRGGAKGAGLGLAIVSRVIQRAGGKLKLSANHPHGLIVELILPITNKRNEKPVVEDQTKPVDAVISSQDELLPIIQEKNGN